MILNMFKSVAHMACIFVSQNYFYLSTRKFDKVTTKKLLEKKPCVGNLIDISTTRHLNMPVDDVNPL